MLPELIKLSKELFELDLVDESIEIDNMIHKLYGNGSYAEALDAHGVETYLYEESCPSSKEADIEESIYQEALQSGAGHRLSSLIIECLDDSQIEIIKEALQQHLE